MAPGTLHCWCSVSLLHSHRKVLYQGALGLSIGGHLTKTLTQLPQKLQCDWAKYTWCLHSHWSKKMATVKAGVFGFLLLLCSCCHRPSLAGGSCQKGWCKGVRTSCVPYQNLATLPGDCCDPIWLPATRITDSSWFQSRWDRDCC